MKFFFQNIFRIYKECLYSANIHEIQDIDPLLPITFDQIDFNNFRKAEEITGRESYLPMIYKMLKNGDHGLFIRHNEQYVGFGWAKSIGSTDDFFVINQCYLCRFFVHSNFRGMNLYPASILKLIEHMHELKGYEKFYIAAGSDNYSSIKGITKMGFKLVKKDVLFIRILRFTIRKYKL